MNRRVKNVFITFSNYCCVLLCIWFLTPYISRNVNTNILFLIFGGFLGLNGLRFLKLRRNAILAHILLWLMMIWMYREAGISSCAWGNIYLQIYFWMIFMAYVICVTNNDRYFLLKLRWIIIVIMMINIVDNIRLLIETPNISEVINMSYGYMYLKTNAGQTSFSFICVLFIIGLLYMQQQKYTIMQKTVMRVAIVLALCYIFMAGRGTAVIVLTIFTIMFLVYLIAHKYFRDSMSAYIFFAALFIVSIYLIFPAIVAYLDEVYEGERIVSRLKEVVNMLYGVEEYTTFDSGEGRMELSKASIETWLKTPRSIFMGIGDHRSNEVSGNLKIGISNHAEFFDVFARYGLIGASIFFSLFYKSLKFGMVSVKKRKDWLFFIIPIFIYGCINNITKYGGMAVMIYLFCLNILSIEKE